MHTFLTYFKKYFTRDFSLMGHLLVVIFLGICIGLNYHYTIYATYFRVRNYSETGVLLLWGMYYFAFSIPIILLYLTNKKSKRQFSPQYLLLGAIATLIIALDSSYYLLKYFRILTAKMELSTFAYGTFTNIMSLFSVIIPLLLILFFVKKTRPHNLGLSLKGTILTPYFLLIAFMIPVVFIAAYLDGNFLEYYPSYKRYLPTESGESNLMRILLYEISYGFDFVSVEMLFRGFMVVSLSKFAGKQAILPMVSCYVFLHFGKPMMETIGSVFGGFALGILAFESKNIYGGIILHLGVAWSMEIAAYSFLKIL